MAGARHVVISETGWPSAGNAQGAAVPSVANANLFALQFLTWAATNNIPAFYFEAFDETWKVASEGPQGANWGIWDTLGVLKPGMDAFFKVRLLPSRATASSPDRPPSHSPMFRLTAAAMPSKRASPASNQRPRPCSLYKGRWRMVDQAHIRSAYGGDQPRWHSPYPHRLGRQRFTRDGYRRLPDSVGRHPPGGQTA